MTQFEAQFPIALDIFVRGLRAGHPVTSALDLLSTRCPTRSVPSSASSSPR